MERGRDLAGGQGVDRRDDPEVAQESVVREGTGIVTVRDVVLSLLVMVPTTTTREVLIREPAVV